MLKSVRDLPSLLETGEFGRILWRWAGGVVLGAIVNELLPVLFGTGEDYVWDWSFTYVTVRFVLLPLFCFVHFVLAGVFALRWFRNKRPVSPLPIVSVAASVANVVTLLVHPLPWFV